MVKKKLALEEELKVKNREVLEWVDLTEQTFDFACYAHIWFEKGDDKAKRAILACLGSNLTLKGKKVFVNYHSFIKTLIKSRQAVEEELERARTSKISSRIRQNPTKCEVSSLGLRELDSNQRPIAYICPTITNRDGLYHSRCRLRPDEMRGFIRACELLFEKIVSTPSTSIYWKLGSGLT
jgi:hypothetical protein